MLKPSVDVKEFEKYGFKKCKGDYGKAGCYYLCVNRGTAMIFVSSYMYDIIGWSKFDPRIHKNPNCTGTRDMRTALDITYELIKADMLTMEVL